MLRVEVKGTGDGKKYFFKEETLLTENCELVAQDGHQSGRLIAAAGGELTAPDAEALGIMELLEARPASKAQAKPKAKTKPAAKSRRKAK